MTINGKIKLIRITEGFKQTEFAKLIGLSGDSSVREVESGKRKEVGSAKIERICKRFPKYALWLTTGEVQPPYQISPGLDISENEIKIQVLSWNQAEKLTQTEILSEPLKSFDNETILIDITEFPVSSKAFALTVGDDKMQNKDHPYNTKKGAKILIDPAIKLHHDSLIIAKFNNEIIYKHYTEDFGKKFLSSLNPKYQYAEIKNTDEFIYIGTVLSITNITITYQKTN